MAGDCMLMRTNLEVKIVNAGCGTNQELLDNEIKVGASEAVALIGANGAGKSTLLRVISGLLRPERGRVAFQQRDVTGLPPERLVHLGIAHVPQGRRLFSDLSVRENLLLGAWARREPAAIAADLERMLDLFPSLADRLALPARQLSGGEQQMAAVARALRSEERRVGK